MDFNGRNRLAWGILGTGSIARTFAQGIKAGRMGRLLGVASRTAAKAASFARDFGAERSYGSYRKLLDDPGIQAVYISTPHPQHARWSVAAARAGKHILCEKPMGMNAAEAGKVLSEARRRKVFFMEAFMYRCHPQTLKLAGLLRRKAVGEVRWIKAVFGFQTDCSPRSRLWSRALGGGGILDVGCYPVSMSRLLAGAALGRGPAEPLEVSAVGSLGPTGVDAYSAALFKFPGGIVAQLECAVGLRLGSYVEVIGDKGRIHVPEPWTPSREGGTTSISITDGSGRAREIRVAVKEGLYSLEADTVARAIADGRAPYPAMGPEDSLGNMRALDRWRKAIGLSYPADQRRVR